MKASVTRYEIDDNGEAQIVVRLCPENAAILLEMCGSADSQIMDEDGDDEAIDPQSITSGVFFSDLEAALKPEERRKFYLHDNISESDGIDFCVCRKDD